MWCSGRWKGKQKEDDQKGNGWTMQRNGVTRKYTFWKGRHKRNIIQRIKERRLNLFGHICRMEDSRLVKEVVFRDMKWKTKRGWPKKEWLDDVKEWCNKETYVLKRKAQDRDAWKIVIKCALDTNGWWTYGTLGGRIFYFIIIPKLPRNHWISSPQCLQTRPYSWQQTHPVE